MGEIRNGILGGFNGKVGNVIGQNYGGISVMRARPKAVSNPKTEAQQIQRIRMKTCAEFFGSCYDVLRLSNWQKSCVKSGYTEAVKRNLKYISSTDGKSVEMDLFSLEFGEWLSPSFENIKFTASALSEKKSLTLSATWENSQQIPSALDDDLLIVFVAIGPNADPQPKTASMIYAQQTYYKRSELSAQIVVPLPMQYSDKTQLFVATSTGNPRPRPKVITIPAKNVVRFSQQINLTK